jgi:hypothetical protein
VLIHTVAGRWQCKEHTAARQASRVAGGQEFAARCPGCSFPAQQAFALDGMDVSAARRAHSGQSGAGAGTFPSSRSRSRGVFQPATTGSAAGAGGVTPWSRAQATRSSRL